MSTAAAGIEVKVPDIGDFDDVPVIEVLVAVGDAVAPEDPLVTLESDKATMDVPSPAAGTVRELLVKLGDRISAGSPIVVLEPAATGDHAAPETAGDQAPTAEPSVAGQASTAEPAAADAAPTEPPAAGKAAPAAPPEAGSADAPEAGPADAPEAGPAVAPEAGPVVAPEPSRPTAPRSQNGSPVYASPSVRRLARELGVDLHVITGSGRKGRILAEDVRTAGEAASGVGAPGAGGRAADSVAGAAGLQIAPWPSVDFEKFGPVERVKLSRIQRISGPALARNWVMIPHVTHNDEADITELEVWRKQLNAEQGPDGVKLTMVSFLVAACVAALKRFPTFNASLDGDEIVLRRSYNIGFAADTPGGLVVPVIRDADHKGLLEIARELQSLSESARAGKLKLEQLMGGTFTISSLGGIGGTSFTPIINAPEVAILGVTRAAVRPVWDEQAGEFAPRLMLPLSLSYDHRVIDGAAAARFVVHLAGVIADLRRALL